MSKRHTFPLPQVMEKAFKYSEDLGLSKNKANKEFLFLTLILGKTSSTQSFM